MTERVVIVGGGLAGLAAAVALAPRRFDVTLLESRPRWGGRASSFVDQATGERIDNCQHVALGCCTNFLHFCRTVGIDRFFCREERLTFVGPDGVASELSAAPLPAPLHLVPAFAGLKLLSWREKWRLALGLNALARTNPAACGDETFLHWLERHGQPLAAIEHFWHVVLVSALSETLDRIDVGHARKVFVDSFLRNRHGWEVWLPTVPLDELYDAIETWLAARGVTCRLRCGAARVAVRETGTDPRSTIQDPRLPSPPKPASGRLGDAAGVELRGGEIIEADQVILAVPQFLLAELLPDEWRALPAFATVAQLETAPISSVHLWFDRPITRLRHATFVGKLSQWMFNRSEIQKRIQDSEFRSQDSGDVGNGHHYQVVISASREVAGRPQGETIRRVVEELVAVWPAVHDARLVHSRLVTEHKAVVSMLPGVDQLRPAQSSPIDNLHLAGDWTRTGWPGTMEGAVRSGYLAAEGVLRRCGRFEPLLQPDLPAAFLSRVLLGLS